MRDLQVCRADTPYRDPQDNTFGKNKTNLVLTWLPITAIGVPRGSSL